MDPATTSVVTASLLVGSLISGAVEALVGELARRGFDGAGRLFQKLRGGRGTPLDQAYAEAVEACSALVASELALGGGRQQERARKLLRGQVFEREATRHLLFGERPKRQELLDAYRQLCAEDGEAATEVELEGVSRLCNASFTQIQTSLAKQEQVAGLLNQAKAEAWNLEIGFEQILPLVEQVAENTARTATATEATAATLGRVEPQIFQLAENARRAQTTTQRREAAYLRWLMGQCDELPLLSDSRDVKTGVESPLEPSLEKVYLDLATTQGPSWSLVGDRLGLTPQQLEALADGLRKAFSPEGPGRRGLKMLETLEAADADLLPALGQLNHEQLKKSPALRQLVGDEQRLRHALAPLTTLEALLRNLRFVLLGGPGSGKSTFVQHVARLSARWRLAGIDAGAAAPPSGSVLRWFPVRILVRRWGSAAAKELTPQKDLLQLAFSKQASQLPWEEWQEVLHRPDTLVLFDGLDEVPGADPAEREAGREDTSLRKRLVLAIQELCSSYPDARVVVTCREKPFTRGPYRFPGLPVLELAALDEERIGAFCQLWHEEMLRIRRLPGERSARLCQDRLRSALADPRRAELRKMAETPLLLTMLAKVNLRDRLPEGRLALFGECVDQLLWEWEKKKSADQDEGEKGESLDQLLRQAPATLTRGDLERVLWQLVYEVHPSVSEGVADVPEWRLRTAVEAVRGVAASATERAAWAGWASRVTDFLRQRDGLLVYRDDKVFSFPHRSFQEYLAARWLAQTSDLQERAVQLLSHELWDEVVRLACCQFASESRGRGLWLLDWLARHDTTAQPTPDGRRRLMLLGQLAHDLKLQEAENLEGPDADTKEALLQRLDEGLTQLLQDSNLPAPERFEAGEILSDLGIVPPDLRDRVEIPDRSGLGYTFKIGKYPVTNSEYRKFVDAGGYRGRKWWRPEAEEELKKVWGSFPSAPALWDDAKWNRDTFPVVGISWFEALAYCVWLENELRAKNQLPAGHTVTLPTEKEWETAAKGPGSGKYPWGDRADASQLNCEESGFGRTTPVHMHPAQTKEPELFDLVGNVWEWSADRDTGGLPWIRGGAYYSALENATTAARSWSRPWGWNDGVGFRVVLVPSSRRASGS